MNKSLLKFMTVSLRQSFLEIIVKLLFRKSIA